MYTLKHNCKQCLHPYNVTIGPDSDDTVVCERCKAEQKTGDYYEEYELACRIIDFNYETEAETLRGTECRSCGTALDLPEDDSVKEIICPSCGIANSFDKLKHTEIYQEKRDANNFSFNTVIPCRKCGEFGIMYVTELGMKRHITCSRCGSVEDTFEYEKETSAMALAMTTLHQFLNELPRIEREGVICPSCGGKFHPVFNKDKTAKCDFCDMVTPHTYYVSSQAVAINQSMGSL